MIDASVWSIPIDTLGVPATFQSVKPPKAVIALPKIGLKTIIRPDDQLIQSIGFGGKVLTIKAVDMGSTIPCKFDTVTISGKALILDSVIDVIEPNTGTTIGWVCHVRGNK